MTARRVPAILGWATLVGVTAAGAGLAWDAVLHARDPLLAQHESVLTARNPAHALLAAGLILALVAQAALLGLKIPAVARRAFAALVAVFMVGVGTAVGWSQQVTATQERAARNFVDSTRAAIVKYRDVNVAYHSGYLPMTPLNWPVVEWVNPGYTQAGRVLDLQRPERLMYVSAPGGLMLAGAMFVLPAGRQAPNGVAGGLAHWHGHRDLCYLPTGAIAGTNGYGTPCPAGSAAKPTPLMLHVWIVANPQGAFADDLTPAAISALVKHA